MSAASVAEEAFCSTVHPTYGHRIDNPDAYDWCTVPEQPWDVILFAGIAIVVSCVWQGSYQSLLVLISGGVLMAFAYPFNLRQIGNSVSIWLGITPYELFFYIFLPPLLLDAALKIDWYMFKKVSLHVITMAFVVVLCTCGLLIPIMLYVFQMQSAGWKWYDAALFGSMIASTDAVAIVAVLKTAGGPEHLRIILEGESLLNDASSFTLFSIFIAFVVNAAESETGTLSASAGAIIWKILWKMVWLAVGGGLIGFGFGWVTRQLLRGMQRWGASAEQQIALTVAGGYLVFYTANSPADVSGVVAVAVYGLYGSATSKFDISPKLEESGSFESFWDTFAFVANGIVFFFAGASSLNFLIRSANNLNGLNRTQLGNTVWRAPLVWLALNLLRFVLIGTFKPLFWLTLHLTWRECIFLAAAGLRGSVSLILTQAVIIESPVTKNTIPQSVQAEVVMFTVVFVLLTLLVNAPLLPLILRWTRLNVVPPQHVKMRQKAIRLLAKHTDTSIRELRDDDDEMLRGVDWEKVERFVDMRPKLAAFAEPNKPRRRVRQGFHRRRVRKDFEGDGSTGKLGSKVNKSENDLMADLEAGLSQPGALARTNGRPMDDSAREDQVLPRPTAPKQAFRSSNRSDTETVSEGDESDDVGSGLDDELPFLSPQPNVARASSMLHATPSMGVRRTVDGRPSMGPTSPQQNGVLTEAAGADGRQAAQPTGEPSGSSAQDGSDGGIVDRYAAAPDHGMPAGTATDLQTIVSSPATLAVEGRMHSGEGAASASGVRQPGRSSLDDAGGSHNRALLRLDSIPASIQSGLASAETTIRKQESAPRASLASLLAPPDDEDTTAAGGSGAAAGTDERVDSTAQPAAESGEVELAERRSAVGPRVSILGPLPDIPRRRPLPGSAEEQQPASSRVECEHESLQRQTLGSGRRSVMDIFPSLGRPGYDGSQSLPLGAARDREAASRPPLPPAMLRELSDRQSPQNTIGRDAQLSDSALMAASRPQHSSFADSRPVIRFPGSRTARAPAASPLGGSPVQGSSPTRSMRSATAQLSTGSPFAVVSQQRALGDQYEEVNAHTWTSGITGSGRQATGLHGTSAFPHEGSAGSLTGGASLTRRTGSVSPTRSVAASPTQSWHAGVLPKSKHIFVPAASDASEVMSEVSEVDTPDPTAEELADMRVRICVGMKRYFHQKNVEGLLSNAALRILSHSCDSEIDNPDTPLALWDTLEKEVRGGYLGSLTVRMTFYLRRAGLAAKHYEHIGLVRWGFIKPGYGVLRLLHRLLGKQLLQACEVAMEYLLALTHSPQVHWLSEHAAANLLLDEVEAESDRVWNFIIAREIETPDRFRAIQSYRAAMAVLRQQLVFVEHLQETGMLSEREAGLMSVPIDMRIRKLSHQGPVWRAPLTHDVLRSIPILHEVPKAVLGEIAKRGSLAIVKSGAQIHESNPEEGIIIVTGGLVKVAYNEFQGTSQTYYIGVGGMFGIFSALTGESLAGRAVAFAEGNALGKGPQILRLGPEDVAWIRRRAAAGDPVFMQLEVDMYRVAALYVVERYKPHVLEDIRRALRRARLAQDRAAAAEDNTAGAAAQRLRSLFPEAQAREQQHAALARQSMGTAPLLRRKSVFQSLQELADSEDTIQQGRGQDARPPEDRRREHDRAAAHREHEKEALQTWQQLHADLAGAELVEVPPGGALPLACHIVLMRGAATVTSADHTSEEQHAAPAVLLRLEGDARAGWDRMLTAGPGGATLVVAAADGEQLDEMLAGLQEDSSGPRGPDRDGGEFLPAVTEGEPSGQSPEASADRSFISVGRLRGLIAAPPSMAAKLIKTSTHQVEGMLRSAAVQGRPNLRRLSMAIGSGRSEIEAPYLHHAASKRQRRPSADHQPAARHSEG